MFLSKLHIAAFPPLAVFVSRGPRVVASAAAFHARVRGSFPGLGGLKEKKVYFHS